MKIELTPEDKLLGIRDDDCKCPVALAISRTIGHPCSVLAAGTVFDEVRRRMVGDLPRPVKVAIHHYDGGGEMIIDSFEFEVVR